ncbi:MAG: cupin domain-containing protein [Pseudomonadota bacterium]|jgi:transcriptional regulator with XRE-family HTH domain
MPLTKPRTPARTKTAASKTKKTRSKAATIPDKGTDGLQIGLRVKHARMLAGKRMRDLADEVGYTESMISKIESGRVVPPLAMLQKIVVALGRDMSSFFGSDISSPGIVLRSGQRAVLRTDPLREGPGVSYERLVPFAAGNLLECNIHVIEPGSSKVDKITHQGETVGYVLEGRIELVIDTTSYELGAGDSFFFKNHLTNRYHNPGPGMARVLWVNTPQIH